MDNMTLIAVASIATAGLTTGIGCMCPALGEGRAEAVADESGGSADVCGLAWCVGPFISQRSASRTWLAARRIVRGASKRVGRHAAFVAAASRGRLALRGQGLQATNCLPRASSAL